MILMGMTFSLFSNWHPYRLQNRRMGRGRFLPPILPFQSGTPSALSEVVMVAIFSDDQPKYIRTIDLLIALAAEKITDVIFNVNDEN